MSQAKSTVREQMRQKLAGWTAAERLEASHALVERLTGLDVWKKATVIGLFAGRSDEMETSLLWAVEQSAGKTFLYPKVVGDDLHFLVVEAHADLQPGKWKLHEPRGGEPRVPELVLVPGVAFDAQGNRMGRGKGFYDRWLAAYAEVRTVGVCFDVQIVAELPVEPHDRRMDLVVTEKNCYGIAT